MQTNARSLFALPLLAAITLSACASEVDPLDDGDVGEIAAAISTSSCKLSRSAILASVSGGRRAAIARGFTWYDAQVPYSQSRYRKDANGSYRTDCSGFVSMSWQLGTSYTTASFSSGGGKSGPIGSYDNLEPGDAIVRRVNGAGHIVLFLGWNDSAHSAACVLEQASTASDMQFRARTTSSLKAGSFKAIRADGLPAGATSTTSADEDDDDGADDAPTGSDGAGNGSGSGSGGEGTGMKCGSTGQRNPGNNGSGLICVAGFCKPGCLSNAQCPGSKSCVGGQCR